jgi:3-oxoisoapionate kinase
MDNLSGHQIFLSYYGDDFTGSTDVMESLTLNGLPAALFLNPPTLEEIEKFEFKNPNFSKTTKLKAFGVAGVSRSMSPAQMSEALPEIFFQISHIPSKFFHYKVCSTFDSSPEIGSIGHAIDLAIQYFPSQFIPLIIGAPALNRFCAFGNLFARVGEITYRLDRHPTMSKHPVTPMKESDLRLHLGRQTSREVKLLDLLTLESTESKVNHIAEEAKNSKTSPFLLIDIINDNHLLKAGKLVMEHANDNHQLIVGSSGVENALASYLQEKEWVSKQETDKSVKKAKKVIVMAGSCSPATKKQIEWAIKAGFETIRIASEKLVDPEEKVREIERVVSKAKQILHSTHLVLFTALGPEDEAINRTREKLNKLSSGNYPADYLAKIQGEILSRILEDHNDARVAVAGGDTSGHVSQSLEIYALEVLIPIAPGAPLCIAHSKNKKFDGLEIALKGGQNGKENYFESILLGETQK